MKIEDTAVVALPAVDGLNRFNPRFRSRVNGICVIDRESRRSAGQAWRGYLVTTCYSLFGRLTALAMVSFSVPCLAQQVASPTDIPTGRETQVLLSTDFLYDSNVARSDEAVAAARGLKLADELITPEGSVTIARQLGRELVFLHADASYIFHRIDTVLNREHINVLAGATASVARCQEVATGGYTRQEVDLADQSLVSLANSHAVLVNTQDIGTLGLKVTCGRAIGLAPTASVTQTWRDNSASVFKFNDSNTTAYTAGIAYQRPALGSITLFGNYSEITFPDRPNEILVDKTLVPTGQLFAYNLYAGGLTYDRHLGGRIEGVATISYTLLEPNSLTTPKFQGFTYASDILYRLNYRIKLHASVIQATAPSNRIDANYSINQTYEADIDYAVGLKLDFNFHVQSETQDFHTDIGAPLIDLTKETTDGVLATATYNLNRHLAASLYIGDEHRTANFPGLSYSSTKIGVTLKATY